MSSDERAERLRARVRQLILMRETGPKRAGWHAARMRLIWQLHDELRASLGPDQGDEGTQTRNREGREENEGVGE
jgi:hypothetical protein